MYTTTKLKNHPYCQCEVRAYDDGAIVFISYATPVILIDPEGWLSCTGTYSQTTRKQIGYFLREYVPSAYYYTVKRLHADNLEMNIHTGEVRPLG
jgi:hypothetical protein